MVTWKSRSSGSAHGRSGDSNRRDDDGVRLGIEAALARRGDKFALSHLAWNADGYILKFRLGLLDVVRTAVGAHVVEDFSRMDRMLDGVRLTFQSLNPF